MSCCKKLKYRIPEQNITIMCDLYFLSYVEKCLPGKQLPTERHCVLIPTLLFRCLSFLESVNYLAVCAREPRSALRQSMRLIQTRVLIFHHTIKVIFRLCGD